jgi:hypothetical protein
MLAKVVIFAIVGVAFFIALLFFVVESWTTRIILTLIVAAAWFFFGIIGTMIASAVLSIGILIASKVPKISSI